jgi:tripartite-type tricarboxylate transporter receptor subunit TctC
MMAVTSEIRMAAAHLAGNAKSVQSFPNTNSSRCAETGGRSLAVTMRKQPRLPAFRFALVLGFALAFGVAAALAEDYPVRPVRIIIGFGPGASGDIAARILAQSFGRLLGQQFVVENRPGAGSNIATNFVAHAPKDGYTLLQGTVANTINAAITPNLNFDFAKDFTPIAMFTTLPNILVAIPAIGVRSVEELIKLARAKPDRLAFGSAGVGSGSHFTGELFNVMAGTRLLHVPYAGTGQAVTDLLGGRLQVMFSPASTVLQHVAEGKLVALASTGLQRAGAAPDLPTVSEAGLAGFDTSGWFGLLAPAGVSRDIVERLAAATRQAATSPDVVATLAPQGFDMTAGAPEEFAAFIRTDIAKWARVAAAAGITRQ